MYHFKVVLLTTLLFINASGVSAQEEFLSALSNESNSGIYNFRVDLSDDKGNEASIPVSLLKGKQPGPTFTVVAGVHGYEYPPILAAQEIIQQIDPELITGSLIIIPIANPHSFYSRSPFVNPSDNLNLNRSFPGKPSGTITERIANFLTEVVIANSDIFLDIHGGDANEDLLPFACYYNNESKPQQTEQAATLAKISGFDHVVSYPYTLEDDQPAKYAFKQAVQDGKVGLSIECGKLGNVQPEAVEMIKSGVMNILAELKMYPGFIVSKDFKMLDGQSYIRSEHQGVFFSAYTSGDIVQKGEVVGEIKNEFGEMITEFISPVSGIILYKIGTPPVNKGETIMCIGYNQEEKKE